jgi:hypothetical protein
MGPMREESGQQPQALPPLGKSSRDGEPQLNPDSWRKIRKTAAKVFQISPAFASRPIRPRWVKPNPAEYFNP